MLLDLSITSSTLAALKLASTDVTPHSSRPAKRSQPSTLGPSGWPAAPATGSPLVLTLPPLPTFRSTFADIPPAPPIGLSNEAENQIQETRLIAVSSSRARSSDPHS